MISFAYVLIIFIYSLWWYITIPKDLPPGPRGFPFFGVSLTTWGIPAVVTLRRWTERYGPLYSFYIGHKLVIVISDNQIIHEAFVKSGDAYAGRKSMHTLVPDEFDEDQEIDGRPTNVEFWISQRRFFMSTLHKLGVGGRTVDAKVKAEVEHLIEEIDKYQGREFDLGSLIMQTVANTTCQLLFGTRFEYGDQNFMALLNYIYRSKVLLKDVLSPIILWKSFSMVASMLPEIQNRLKSNKYFMDFLSNQIKIALKDYHIGDEPSNVAQAYCKTQMKTGFNSIEQLQVLSGKLFMGGALSSARNILDAIDHVINNPVIQDNIYDEIKRECGTQTLPSYIDRKTTPLTESTIKNTLYIPGRLIFTLRTTVTNTLLRGYNIPKSAIILAVLNPPNSIKINTNMISNFSNSDNMRKDKAGKKDTFQDALPFGAGKRSCVGEPFANMQLYIIFAALMLRYKFYSASTTTKTTSKVSESDATLIPPFMVRAVARES